MIQFSHIIIRDMQPPESYMWGTCSCQALQRNTIQIVCLYVIVWGQGIQSLYCTVDENQVLWIYLFVCLFVCLFVLFFPQPQISYNVVAQYHINCSLFTGTSSSCQLTLISSRTVGNDHNLTTMCCSRACLMLMDLNFFPRAPLLI